MLIISETLKQIEGIKYFESGDSTTFSLPRSTIQPYIFFTSKVSLNEITQIAYNLSKEHLEGQYNTLMELFKGIKSNNFTSKLGIDDLLGNIHNNYRGFTTFKHEFLKSDKVLKVIVHENGNEFSKLTNENRLTRKFCDDIITGVKVCINTTQNYYLTGHLTQADLSLLSDFDTIKEDMNIVNGSFVTLQKPLKLGRFGNR